MSKIKTVGIVGTGVIGTGWIIRNLAHNKIVHAYDQNILILKTITELTVDLVSYSLLRRTKFI